VSDVPLRDIRPEMISSFVNRSGTSDETKRKKYRVVAACFASPSHVVCEHVSNAPPCSDALLFILHALHLFQSRAQAAFRGGSNGNGSPGSVIDADTLHTFVLLLYGAALRRGEALRLRLEDVDVAQSLIHIRGTKFFKTRIVPLSTSLNSVIRASSQGMASAIQDVARAHCFPSATERP